MTRKLKARTAHGTMFNNTAQIQYFTIESTIKRMKLTSRSPHTPHAIPISHWQFLEVRRLGVVRIELFHAKASLCCVHVRGTLHPFPDLFLVFVIEHGHLDQVDVCRYRDVGFILCWFELYQVEARLRGSRGLCGGLGGGAGSSKLWSR